MTPLTFQVPSEEEGVTLSAALRTRVSGASWNAIRRLIETRQVRIGGQLCVDPARRLHAGEAVELLARPAPKPHVAERIEIRHLDAHLIVVEKPAGLSTVRHPSERLWSARRKALEPTLEDLVPRLIVLREGRSRKGPPPRVRVVQRLDKETSGLLVFARTVLAEASLGLQFRRHTVLRRYVTLVPGVVGTQRIVSRLVRDRGDGRRGGTNHSEEGKEAITHVEVAERLPGYTLLSCQLETGRTHQIRIHLAELGHPVCGEKVYNRQSGVSIAPDVSGSSRLALHAAELGFVHPVTGETLQWSMPLPRDFQALLDRLRGGP